MTSFIQPAWQVGKVCAPHTLVARGELQADKLPSWGEQWPEAAQPSQLSPPILIFRPDIWSQCWCQVAAKAHHSPTVCSRGDWNMNVPNQLTGLMIGGGAWQPRRSPEDILPSPRRTWLLFSILFLQTQDIGFQSCLPKCWPCVWPTRRCHLPMGSYLRYEMPDWNPPVGLNEWLCTCCINQPVMAHASISLDRHPR